MKATLGGKMREGTDRARPQGLRRPVALVVLALLGPLASCVTPAPPSGPVDGDAPIQVAFLNQGAADDEVWTAAHARAAQDVADHFGERVEVDFIERVEATVQAPALIDRLAADGVDLIVATSIPFSEAMRAGAARHPGVRFEQARSLDTSPNLGVFAGADEEPLYLAGIAAGEATETSVIGVVGTVREPETLRHINALTLGARSVDPSVRVLVSWVGNWWDPESERRHATELVEMGADVVATGFISLAVGEVARATGTAWIGHGADRNDLYPDVWLTAAVPDWGPFYVDTVQSVLDGTWTADSYYGDMADGFTDMATMGERVPLHVRDRIKSGREEFLRGDRDVFTGPIVDNDSVERVQSGQTLEVSDLLTMDFLVEGVEEVTLLAGPT